jgi:hypothetical protein
MMPNWGWILKWLWLLLLLLLLLQPDAAAVSAWKLC